jgi:hypothetical protein
VDGYCLDFKLDYMEFEFRTGQAIFRFPNRPHCLRVTLSLLPRCYRGSFSGVNHSDPEAEDLVPSSVEVRVSEAIHVLPSMPVCRGERKTSPCTGLP